MCFGCCDCCVLNQPGVVNGSNARMSLCLFNPDASDKSRFSVGAGSVMTLPARQVFQPNNEIIMHQPIHKRPWVRRSLVLLLLLLIGFGSYRANRTNPNLKKVCKLQEEFSSADAKDWTPEDGSTRARRNSGRSWIIIVRTWRRDGSSEVSRPALLARTLHPVRSPQTLCRYLNSFAID